MTLDDFFQQLHDFGTSMNLNADELYSEHSLQFKINQNKDYKPDYAKNGIELDNKDCYIVFLAVYQREENQLCVLGALCADKCCECRHLQRKAASVSGGCVLRWRGNAKPPSELLA